MKGFKIVLGIAVVYVLAHQVALLFPAKEEWLHNMGMLFQGLSLSYIAAFIFFLVHDHFPLKRTGRKFERIIDKELSDLWTICHNFMGTLKKLSTENQVKMNNTNFHEAIPILLKNLPVNSLDHTKRGPVKKGSIPIPKPEELNPPINVFTKEFYKWSDAFMYINSKATGTLNRLLYVQTVVKQETLVDLFDLVKSLEESLTIVHLYESQGNKHFDNDILIVNVIKIYEVTIKLRDYNKAYNKV